MNNTEHAQLLRKLADGLSSVKYVSSDLAYVAKQLDLASRARAAAAEIEGREMEYRYTVTVDDDWMAGGSAFTQEQAEREARHYLLQYEPDGDCVATVERCVVLARFGGGEAGVMARSLPDDIARCRGYGDGPEDWLPECADCLRRTSPGGETHMEPPRIITFICDYYIEP